MGALLAIEERFGIELPDSEFEGVETVGDAVQLLLTKIAPRKV